MEPKAKQRAPFPAKQKYVTKGAGLRALKSRGGRAQMSTEEGWVGLVCPRPIPSGNHLTEEAFLGGRKAEASSRSLPLSSALDARNSGRRPEEGAGGSIQSQCSDPMVLSGTDSLSSVTGGKAQGYNGNPKAASSRIVNRRRTVLFSPVPPARH